MFIIKKSFYPWAAVTLLCMAAIFWFSSQNADESGELSGYLTDWIENLIGTGLFGGLSGLLETVIRKAAHIAVYSALGFSAAYTFRQIIQKKQYIFKISLLFCALYAVSDELHQYFVPGRACMWQDLLIDTLGALLGIGAAFIIFSVKRRLIK